MMMTLLAFAGHASRLVPMDVMSVIDWMNW